MACFDHTIEEMGMVLLHVGLKSVPALCSRIFTSRLRTDLQNSVKFLAVTSHIGHAGKGYMATSHRTLNAILGVGRGAHDACARVLL